MDDLTTKGRDPDYLTRREAQARTAAEASTDPAARVAHRAMAKHYAEELRAIGAMPLA